MNLPVAEGQSLLAKGGGGLAATEEIVLGPCPLDADVGDAILHAQVKRQGGGVTEIERQVGARSRDAALDRNASVKIVADWLVLQL